MLALQATHSFRVQTFHYESGYLKTVKDLTQQVLTYALQGLPVLEGQWLRHSAAEHEVAGLIPMGRNVKTLVHEHFVRNYRQRSLIDCVVSGH